MQHGRGDRVRLSSRRALVTDVVKGTRRRLLKIRGRGNMELRPFRRQWNRVTCLLLRV